LVAAEIKTSEQVKQLIQQISTETSNKSYGTYFGHSQICTCEMFIFALTFHSPKH